MTVRIVFPPIAHLRKGSRKPNASYLWASCILHGHAYGVIQIFNCWNCRHLQLSDCKRECNWFWIWPGSHKFPKLVSFQFQKRLGGEITAGNHGESTATFLAWRSWRNQISGYSETCSVKGAGCALEFSPLQLACKVCATLKEEVKALNCAGQ